MTNEPPTNGELSRRFDDLRSEVRDGNRSIHERLDKMPTNELLLAYLAKTDTEVAGNKKSIDSVKADLDALEKSVLERFADQAKEAVASRRWAVGAVVGVVGLAITILSFARSVL